MSAVLAWLAWAWRWVMSSRVVQGVLALAGIIAYHAYAKWRAGSKAVKEERQKAEQEAHEERAEQEGDVRTARQTLDEEQQERREREKDEDPRDRFERDPFK